MHFCFQQQQKICAAPPRPAPSHPLGVTDPFAQRPDLLPTSHFLAHSHRAKRGAPTHPPPCLHAFSNVYPIPQAQAVLCYAVLSTQGSDDAHSSAQHTSGKRFFFSPALWGTER